MIKINNVPIINPITTFTHNQKEKINFVCDSGTVLWELLRIPTSCNDPITKIGWNTSTEQSSAELSDYLILQLSGTYKIQITYTSTSGVIVRYMIVIEALSLKDTATIPFGGESVEMNTQEGWAKKVEKNLQLLSQNNGNFSIIGVYDDSYEVYDLIVGDLVCISDIKDTYQSGFIYEIMRAEDYTAQNGIVGVVIDVKESGGSVEYDIDGKYYTVAFKGAFLLDSFPFSGNVYYNYTTHELTGIESGNLFVGKYINGVLVIENEMWFDVDVYIPSAMNISKDSTFTITKQLNFVGENVEVSGDLDPDVTTNVTILGQWLSLNGLSYGRTAKYLNFVSVDDEITINHVVGSEYSDIIIKEYPFFRDDDESLIYSKYSDDSFVVGSDNIDPEVTVNKMFFNKTLGSFGVGKNITISGEYAHAHGYNTTASGDYGSHAEGADTIALGEDAHAEGWLTQANGNESHAEGHLSIASGTVSHAEGESTNAQGDYSHAEGNGTTSSGESSHAEGQNTIASGESSHAEGDECKAIGNFGSHAEGYKSIAEGGVSHAEGQECTAIGGVSHAEGYKSIAEGGVSHAEGYQTNALETASHAEGYGTIAQSEYSHAEGRETTASGESSHAEGYLTTASGNHSHAEGRSSVARYEGSHAFANGKFAVAGDAQGERIVCKIATSDNTQTHLVSLLIPENGTFSFRGDIVIKDITNDFVYFFDLTGLVFRISNGVAQIALVPTSSVITLKYTNALMGDVLTTSNIVVDVSGNNLLIDVIGFGSTNIQWVCTLNLTETIG